MTTEIATNESTPQARYRALVLRTAESTLEDVVGPERLQRAMGRFGLAFRAVASSSPQLYECTPASVAQAVGMCALTGLMPGGPYPDVYLIPRRGRDGLELQWQISARGCKRIAERSGAWTLETVLVHEGDEWSLERGLHPDLRHIPRCDQPSWDNLLGGYVVAWPRDTSQRPRFEWLDRAGIEARRAVSDGYRAYEKGRAKSTPWVEWPLEMARKTVLRYAVARGIVELDEVGTAAMGADLRADVIEAEPEPVQVVQPRQVEDRGGMAGLAEVVVDAEPKPTDPTWRQLVELESEVGDEGVAAVREEMGIGRAPTDAEGRQLYLEALSVALDAQRAGEKS
jgi:recombination protein RecT